MQNPSVPRRDFAWREEMISFFDAWQINVISPKDYVCDSLGLLYFSRCELILSIKKVRDILKKYFIPYEGNDHQPHLLRRRAVAFVCMIVIGVQFATLFYSSYIVPRSYLVGAIFANTLVDETNANRVASNESVLTTSPSLTLAAQEKANDMVKNNYFAHTSPTGVTPWQWFANVGYDFSSAGENLAVNFS